MIFFVVSMMTVVGASNWIFLNSMLMLIMVIITWISSSECDEWSKNDELKLFSISFLLHIFGSSYWRWASEFYFIFLCFTFFRIFSIYFLSCYFFILIFLIASFFYLCNITHIFFAIITIRNFHFSFLSHLPWKPFFSQN